MATTTGGMTARAATQRSGGWSAPALAIVIFLLGLYVLAQNGAIFLHNAGLRPGAGRLGLALSFEPDHPGWVRLAAVDPNGAMARAGMRVGDEVRFVDPIYPYKEFPAGERVPLTVRRAGVERSLTVTTLPIRASDAGPSSLRFQYVAITLSAILPVVFGLFVVARSRSRLLVMLLGLCLIGQGAGTSSEAPFWYATVDAIRFGLGLSCAIGALAAIAGLAFAMNFAPEGRRPLSWLDRIVLMAFALAAAGVSWRWIDNGDLAFAPAAGVAGVLLIGAYLTAAWLRCAPASRARFLLLLSGFALLQALPSVFTAVSAYIPPEDPAQTTLTFLQLLFSSLLAPLVLAYAILRQRVLDVGFAINRTLVYGVVSAILLAAFGLIEWAVDHVVPVEGREKSAIVDAVIAVGVFLTFHRVRDVVEHAIEGLFFRRWQKAEAQLRQFVKEAAFATRSEPLTRRFASALSEYAEGAEAAVYLLGQDGAYHRCAGDLPSASEALDPDDPALTAIRAEPRALALDQTQSSLKAALAAPMVNRNEVVGLAVLGPKPSGLDYRPDEVELIGWATRQVGLDLHALKMERLETDKADLRHENSLLSAKVEVLLAGRQPA